MRVVIFCHSLISEWNHGNAHFLRGICSELLARGHQVIVYEPSNAWSVSNLVQEHGEGALSRFGEMYPHLRQVAVRYDPDALDVDKALEGADLVLVHEWNDPALVRRLGERRATSQKFRLLFHDTHHRAATDPQAMAAFDLRHYDGVLAFGAVIRELYLSRGWSQRAWVWHEAADARLFHPLEEVEPDIDLVWVGNWGDEERTAELREFLLGPIAALGLKARVHGVRYPGEAKQALAAAGIQYLGWVPNFEVPKLFAQAKVTVHVPRRPYVKALPGIPTIRVFEALACGIPLVSAPWTDAEGLFSPGEDFLVARSEEEMQRHLEDILKDPDLARSLAEHGRRTVLSRHTCAHRVDELLRIEQALRSSEKSRSAA